MKSLGAKLGPLESSLVEIKELDAQCTEANIEENDYTVFTVDDLKFELDLVQQAVNKKTAFIENQVRRAWKVVGGERLVSKSQNVVFNCMRT